ncbi:hypothetical protein ACIHCM_33110 [Streptomyces sp. NPDC052023]|uniref:hypothetical protein n=1 Tax=Streptomyces sp. NPDC052023 TaxID=3365681 RepID=UPI0037D3A2AB
MIYCGIDWLRSLLGVLQEGLRIEDAGSVDEEGRVGVLLGQGVAQAVHGGAVERVGGQADGGAESGQLGHGLGGADLAPAGDDGAAATLEDTARGGQPIPLVQPMTMTF